MEEGRRKAGSWVACVGIMRVGKRDDDDDVHLRRKSRIDIILAPESKRKRRAIFKTEGSEGCTASEGCTVSSSRRAQGWMTIGAGRLEGKKQNFWSSGLVSVDPHWNRSRQETERTPQCENVYFILVPETSEVQWVFPTCWLVFLYEHQQCLQEASVIDQEVQPS